MQCIVVGAGLLIVDMLRPTPPTAEAPTVPKG